MYRSLATHPMSALPPTTQNRGPFSTPASQMCPAATY